MTKDRHFTGLERMYVAAPINDFYRPKIDVSDAKATIEIDVSESLFHAADAVHGSVHFKMLDDAAFFAANSLEREVLVLTTSFTTYLTRPISSGTIRAEGRVVNRSRSQFIAEGVAYDAEGREIGRGSGIFVRSTLELKDRRGYSLEERWRALRTALRPVARAERRREPQRPEWTTPPPQPSHDA